MLEIRNLHAYYGVIEALHGISIEMPDESIRCVIGSNGAGKTTLLKAISAVIRREGEIVWNGESILERTPQQLAQMGIIHVPAGRLIFPGLTVRENLEVGTMPWKGFWGNKQPYGEEMDTVFKLFPRLKEREKQYGWSLSGGEQQMLAIGRAIMARPRLLMLDEPSMGLAPVVVAELFEKIVEIKHTEKIPILLIEQNARLALRVSDYAYVIEQGVIRMEGPASEMKNDEGIVGAYLGKYARTLRAAEKKEGVS
ncbi:MAG TPA: ABC transporter ATP-binding protein [Candidatus Pullichristensenella avicola]|nr:ABC transporter ATP-binding protein [Candidatus Pullichristensenella avicola]